MKKVIKILILVIFPVLAGVGIGFYGYARYQNHFFPYYMEKASQDNTEDRLVSYLQFTEANVEAEKENEKYDFYYTKNVTNEYGDLFTIAIIRTYKTNNAETKAKTTYYVSYHLAIYNINYTNVASTLDPTNEHKLLYTELPSFSFVLTDKNDDSITSTFESTTIAVVSSNDAGLDTTFVYDYGYSPATDANNNNLNGGNPTSMRYYRLDDTELDSFSTDVKLVIKVSSSWSESDQVDEEIELDNVPTLFNNKNNNKTAQKNVLKEIPAAYNRDIEKAGYFGFVFGHYIWWEALIAIILVGTLCGAFVVVWTADENERKK